MSLDPTHNNPPVAHDVRGVNSTTRPEHLEWSAVTSFRPGSAVPSRTLTAEPARDRTAALQTTDSCIAGAEHRFAIERG
jgi:hypothetical protein